MFVTGPVMPCTSHIAYDSCTAFACVSTTPFGCPVVPDV